MVLAQTAEIVAAALRPSRQKNPAAQKVRECLYIYDYDMASTESVIWMATLPLNVLLDNLPDTCRYSYDIFKMRILGGVLGTLIGAVIGTGAMMLLFTQGFGVPLQPFLVLAIILGSMLGIVPGGLGGWMIGPRLAPKTFWVVRRLTLVKGHPLSEQMAADDLPEYTHWLDGDACRVVRALPFQLLEETMLPSSDVRAQAEESAQSLQLFGSKANANAYRPIVYRATVFYEDLQQRIVRKRQGQKHLSGWHKLQIGAAVGLAVAVLGILFFTIMVVPSLQKTESPASSQGTK